MKIKLSIITFITLLAFSSCSHVTITKTGMGIFAPTSQSTVEIRATLPNRKYEEVGMLTADILGNPATGYNLIREKAAAVGADAVILQNQMPLGNGRLIINGVAIKYSK